MARKRDRRHDNPGRPVTVDSEKMHKVYVSEPQDKVLREAAAREGVSMAEWWRRLASAKLGTAWPEPKP